MTTQGQGLLVNYVRRVRDQTSLIAFLSAKLSHENSLRSTLWGQIALISAVLLGTTGVSIWMINSFRTGSSAWHNTAGLILSVCAFAGSAIVVFVILWMFRPTYQVVLLQPSSLADWWHKHVAQLEASRGDMSLLDRDERAVLARNLADAVDSLHAENRLRVRVCNRLHWAIGGVVAMLMACYALSTMSPIPQNEADDERRKQSTIAAPSATSELAAD